MVKKKSGRRGRETSSMFPSLHQAVVEAVSDDIESTWFQDEDCDTDSNNAYTTHVMGKFKCDNGACSTNGWGSKMVTILIRGYHGNGYNAVVFSQRCRACRHLGKLTLDEESYVDRVAYRLKKWAGIPMQQQNYSRQAGLPHRSELCEGCKKGICRQKNVSNQD